MSGEELFDTEFDSRVYLPVDRNENVGTTYYVMNSGKEIENILKIGCNPINHEALSQEQIEFLRRKLCEINFTSVKIVYEVYMKELVHLVSEAGININPIYEFARNLSVENYNLFLTHKTINQYIYTDDRDTCASLTLHHILNFIKTSKQKGEIQGVTALICMGNAIAEFMFMINNNLSYQDLLKEKGQIHVGYVKQLYWKPKFMREYYHNTGEIKNRYYVNRNNKVHGLYQVFHINGIVIYEVNYSNGVPLGTSTTWYPNGSIESKGTYVNGTLEGTFKEWYISNTDTIQLKFEGEYENGEPIGEWKIWDNQGNFVGERKMVKEYYDAEQIKDLYFLNEQGEYDGIWKSWHSNGSVKFDGLYRNNLMEGLWIEGLPNQIIHLGQYINGKKEGVWSSYYPNGILKKVAHYQGDNLDGPFCLWYKNRTQLAQGEYKNGKKNGTWVEWYENGNLLSKCNYENGNLKGPSVEYHLNGSLIRSAVY